MATFAAVGALALLDPEIVAAATPDPKAPLAPEDARDVLRAPSAPGLVEALGPPAATDAAFQAAVAALTSPIEAVADALASFPGAENNQEPIAPGGETAQSDTGADALSDSMRPLAPFQPSGDSDRLNSSATAEPGLTIDDDAILPGLANDTLLAFSSSTPAPAIVAAQGDFGGATILPVAGFSAQQVAGDIGAEAAAPDINALVAGLYDPAATSGALAHEGAARGNSEAMGGAPLHAAHATDWLDAFTFIGAGAGAAFSPNEGSEGLLTGAAIATTVGDSLRLR